MGVLTGDDIDVELLRDRPTLFYKRLCYFLSADDADRVLAELAFICRGCWDAEDGTYNCRQARKRGQRKGYTPSAETRRKMSKAATAAWLRRVGKPNG